MNYGKEVRIPTNIYECKGVLPKWLYLYLKSENRLNNIDCVYIRYAQNSNVYWSKREGNLFKWTHETIIENS